MGPASPSGLWAGALYLTIFAVAGVLALWTTPVMRRAALNFGIVDRPDGNLKTQKEAVPYLGGLAVYGAFLVSIAATFEFLPEVMGMLLAGAIVVILGLVDDLGGLGPKTKLAGQALAIWVLIKSGVFIKLVFLPHWLQVGLTVLWLLAVCNAFNLIDIMDGLAAGVALIACGFLLAVAAAAGRVMIASLLAALAGALAGFLWYNFEPAKIYLGDTGSLFLGLMIGALAMNNSYTRVNSVAAVAPAVILGVPVFDMLFVMYIRWRRGLPLMRGSPDHFAIRLRHWKLTTRQTVCASYVATALLGCLATAIMLLPAKGAAALLAGTAVAGLSLGFVIKKIDMKL